MIRLLIAAIVIGITYGIMGGDFIIGIYSVEKQEDTVYRMLKEANFNYVHSYHSYRFDPPTEILDMAAKYQMKVLYDLRSRKFRPDIEPEWRSKIQCQINAVKDHPALGLWFAYSEPRTADMPQVREIVEMIRKESTIPTALVIHWRANWENTRGYTDYWMVDLYPIRGHEFPNAPLDQVSRFIGLAARMRVPGAPFIPILQACNFSCFIKDVPEQNRQSLRFPNFIETRYMSLSSLTYGVHGLFYYSLFHCHLDRPEGREFFKNSLKPVVKEVKEFTDIVKEPWKPTAYCYDFNMKNNVNFAYWKRPSGDFIILTNESSTARNLKLYLKAPEKPENGTLIPWGNTSNKTARLEKRMLTVENAGPWESFIWQVK